jgi:hypothetical protein
MNKQVDGIYPGTHAGCLPSTVDRPILFLSFVPKLIMARWAQTVGISVQKRNKSTNERLDNLVMVEWMNDVFETRQDTLLENLL